MKIELEAQVKTMMEGLFEIEDIEQVPDLNDPRLLFGSKSLGFEATVVYLEIKESGKILTQQNEVTLVRVRMIYFYLVAEIAASLGGVARLAHDDGIYAFFQGTTQDSLNSAVKAAMKIKFMLTNEYSKVKKQLDTYSASNFVIGVDDGKVLCAKIGEGICTYGDLVWSGQALTSAKAIAAQLTAPEHIGISELVHYNLIDNVKYNKSKTKTPNNFPVEIWKAAQFTYNDQPFVYYHTSFFWTVS